MDEPKQKPHLAGEPSLRIAQPYAHDQIANAAAPKLRVSLGDLAPVIQKSAGSTHKSNPRIKEDPPLSDFADTESPDRAIDPFQLAQASTERRSSSLPTAPAATVIPSGSEITASGSVNTVAGDTPSFGDWVSNAAQTSWESIAAGGWWSVAGGLAGAMNIDRRIEISKRTSSASIDLGDLLTGRVIDGPVSGANVYVDENDDGIAQASELIGQTDANGNFSIRTTKVGDYIITGGTSTDTGLANNLTLKGVAGSTVITPLTTLVEKYMEMAGVSSDTAESAVKAALGLTGYGIDLRTYDPLAHGDTDATALAIQKLSVQLASAAEIYEKVGSGYGDKFLTAIVAKIDDGTFSAGNTIDFTDGTATTGDLALLQAELETQASTTLSGSLIGTIDTAATSIGTATTLATSGAGSLTTTQQSALNATLTVAEAANATGSYGLLDTAANLYADAITNSGAGTILAGNRNVQFSDAPSIVQITAIDNASGTGTLTYTAISDTAANLATNTGGYLTAAIDATFAAGAASATDIATVRAATTGTLDGSALTAINGTAAAVVQALTDLDTDPTNFNSTLTGAATIAQLATIDAATTGTLTYTAISDTAANLATNTGGYLTGAIDATVTDAATVSQLLAIDGATTGVITYTGIADTVGNFIADNGSYLTGTTNATVTDVATFSDLSTIDGFTSGTVTASDITDAFGNFGTTYTNSASGTVTANGTTGTDAIDFSGGYTKALTINGLAGNDTIIGGNGADTISGGSGIDDMSGGNGADTFVFVAGDSGAISDTTYDIVRDYTTNVTAERLDLVGAASAQADLAGSDVNAAAVGGGAFDLTASITNGVITIGGNDAMQIDTLAEWLDVARLMVSSDTKVGAFQFAGDTYVYQENTGGDLLVQLDNVTGITSVDASAAAAARVLIA